MTEGGNNGIRREAHRPRREQQLEREPRTRSSPTCSPSLSSLRNLEYEQRHQRQQRQASASLLLPQRATAFTSTGTTTRIRARKKMIATPSSPSSPPLSSSSPPLSSSSPSLLRQQKRLLQIQRQWDERATEKRIASRGGCPELVQSGRRREQQYSNLFVQEFQEGEYDYACDEGEGGRHPHSSRGRREGGRKASPPVSNSSSSSSSNRKEYCPVRVLSPDAIEIGAWERGREGWNRRRCEGGSEVRKDEGGGGKGGGGGGEVEFEWAELRMKMERAMKGREVRKVEASERKRVRPTALTAVAAAAAAAALRAPSSPPPQRHPSVLPFLPPSLPPSLLI
ncbi:Hypothetical protein NocV09_08100090, partial [Nannochloropsis oceanica]